MNRKLTAVLPLLLFGIAVAAASAQDEKPMIKLGLLAEGEKDKKDKLERQLDAAALNAATDAFLASRRFNMVERNQLNAVFTEKSLQDFIGGKVNNKLADVQDLDLIGIVSHEVQVDRSEKGAVSKKWILEVRLIEVKTAALLVTVTSDRASLLSMVPPATIREAGALLIQSIRDAFPPLGYVVQMKGKEVVVDLGSEAGVKKGDTLEVVEEGDQIIHPVTGKLLAAPLKVIGELKVVSASPQLATCKRTSGKNKLQPANLVRLKGSESRLIKWLMKLPRIKDELQKQKDGLKKKS